jgi:hypothetical protein
MMMMMRLLGGRIAHYMRALGAACVSPLFKPCSVVYPIALTAVLERLWTGKMRSFLCVVCAGFDSAAAVGKLGPAKRMYGSRQHGC